MIKLSWKTNQDNPFRLISLREIVNAIDGRILVSVGTALMQLRVARFFHGLDKDALLPANAFDQAMLPETRQSSKYNLEYVRWFCEQVGCSLTLRAVNRTDARLQYPGVSLAELASDCDNINQLLKDELDSKLFLRINPQHVPYYNDWSQGWEGVIERFPDIGFDVEEASKCFALSRYTACVFHASRIAEVGAVAVGKAVGYNDPKPSLHSALNYLENALRVARENYPQANPGIKVNVHFYAEIVVHMQAVNQAWRQRVSHMDNKYTEEEAERGFIAIKSLMQHIATRLSASDDS